MMSAAFSRRALLRAALSLSGLLALSPLAELRAEGPQQAIRIVGSSTLYTMTSDVAELFGKGTRYPAPVVESTGTGGGFKLFCAGNGAGTPDIAMASRPMTEGERQQCDSAGVTAAEALPLGTGGVIVAMAADAPSYPLSLRHLWLALAAKVPVDGKLVTNPYRTWRSIDPALPDLPIQVYGPPPTSGTHDALLGMILDVACHEDPAMVGLPLRERLDACERLREDGAYIHAGESDEMLSRRLLSNPKAVGIVGHQVLDQHRGLKAATLNGVAPTAATVQDRSYPLVRTLYLYVKAAHLPRTPGLGRFVSTYLSNGMIGPDGRLTSLGLVPLGDSARQAAIERARTLGPGI
ncbi:substrate-binding domain-containing protein [Novispirillum itersonii]|uniref:Phosphate transport system substrate-binding protein n=1 Tax=Novispirillum itersonii TaxID=189 RepID=A0A7W9ZEP5_NOVIT|nr:substrate-binding domain-containing protein [Novispirillum itersonii]MBB6210131.1 phosphate transport system substrate-binding protein [Novispirillum itersonii]